MAVSRIRYNAVDRKVARLSNGWVPILGANLLHRSHHQLLHSSCVGSKYLDNDDEKIMNPSAPLWLFTRPPWRLSRQQLAPLSSNRSRWALQWLHRTTLPPWPAPPGGGQGVNDLGWDDWYTSGMVVMFTTSAPHNLNMWLSALLENLWLMKAFCKM